MHCTKGTYSKCFFFQTNITQNVEGNQRKQWELEKKICLPGVSDAWNLFWWLEICSGVSEDLFWKWDNRRQNLHKDSMHKLTSPDIIYSRKVEKKVEITKKIKWKAKRRNGSIHPPSFEPHFLRVRVDVAMMMGKNPHIQSKLQGWSYHHWSSTSTALQCEKAGSTKIEASIHLGFWAMHHGPITFTCSICTC